MCSTVTIDDRFAGSQCLRDELAHPVSVAELHELEPEDGYLLVVPLYLSGMGLSKERLRRVVAATIDILDHRSITRRFNRIGITILGEADYERFEKVCYLEASRGQLRRLMNGDMFSEEMSERTKGAFVVWSESDIANRLLET